MAKKVQAATGDEADASLDAARARLARRVEGLHLPRWAELPNFTIYMDQLLLLVERALEPVTSPDDRPLTASMVNNYVKARVMPPVRGKRYGREHIATLVAVCLAKRAFSIGRLAQMSQILVTSEGAQESYDTFCALFEGRMRTLAGLEADAHAREITHEGQAPIIGAAVEALANTIYLDDLLALHAQATGAKQAKAE